MSKLRRMLHLRPMTVGILSKLYPYRKREQMSAVYSLQSLVLKSIVVDPPIAREDLATTDFALTAMSLRYVVIEDSPVVEGLGSSFALLSMSIHTFGSIEETPPREDLGVITFDMLTMGLKDVMVEKSLNTETLAAPSFTLISMELTPA